MARTLPPALPPATKADRVEFRRRLIHALESAGMSGRELERKVGVASGTLAKLHSGKLKLSVRLLREIASVLTVGAETLVADTALEVLLKGAPESKESDALLAARAQIDELRAEAAGLEATVKALRGENAALERALAVANQAERESRLALERLETELAAAKAAVASRTTSQADVERNASDAARSLARAQTELAATRAKLAEVGHAAHAWRTRALQQEQRVLYMEQELVRLQQESMRATSQESGRLLLAGLASLGVGLAIGESSGSRPASKRRRRN